MTKKSAYKEFHPQGRHHHLHRAQDHDQQPPPVRFQLQRQELVPLLPDDVPDNERHKESVPHIRIGVPVAHQRA